MQQIAMRAVRAIYVVESARAYRRAFEQKLREIFPWRDVGICSYVKMEHLKNQARVWNKDRNGGRLIIIGALKDVATEPAEIEGATFFSVASMSPPVWRDPFGNCVLLLGPDMNERPRGERGNCQQVKRHAAACAEELACALSKLIVLEPTTTNN